MVQANLLKLFF